MVQMFKVVLAESLFTLTLWRRRRQSTNDNNNNNNNDGGVKKIYSFVCHYRAIERVQCSLDGGGGAH